MPLLLILAALLLGEAFTFTAAGRTFTVSFIDLAALGVAVAGVQAAWHRRRVRLDAALAAYGAFLALVLVQAAVFPDPAHILGGSSRFVTAAAILFGLSQLVPDRDRMAGSTIVAEGTAPWRWPFALAAFGVVLSVWIGVLLVGGMLDSDRTSFYAIKKAIVIPLGASNFLAAFALVAAMVTGALAVSRRRWLPALTVCALGLVATLSRGALASGVVAVALATVLARVGRPAAARVVAGTAAVAMVWAVLVGAVIAPRAAPSEMIDPGRAQAPAVSRQQAAGAGATDPVAAGIGTPAASGLVAAGERLPPVLRGEFRGRLILYATAWNAFTDQPVLGLGLNRLVTVTAPTGEPHPNAHNLFLHALATTGLLGTAAYLMLWVILALRLLRLPTGAGRLGLLAATAALFLHAQIEALAFTRPVEALLAVMLALGGAGADSWAMREVPLGRFGARLR